MLTTSAPHNRPSASLARPAASWGRIDWRGLRPTLPQRAVAEAIAGRSSDIAAGWVPRWWEGGEVQVTRALFHAGLALGLRLVVSKGRVIAGVAPAAEVRGAASGMARCAAFAAERGASMPLTGHTALAVRAAYPAALAAAEAREARAPLSWRRDESGSYGVGVHEAFDPATRAPVGARVEKRSRSGGFWLVWPAAGLDGRGARFDRLGEAQRQAEALRDAAEAAARSI